jgi:hypothetical protein
MRSAALLFVVCGLVGPAVGEDVVRLSNGQRIVGVVDAEPANAKPGMAAIKTGNGLIWVRADLVAGTEQGFESRRAALKADDYASYLALAKWCLAKEMSAEALELLDHAVSLPTLTAEALELRVRLIDELKGPDAALPLYRAYQKAGYTDPKTLARLQELEDYITGWESRNASVVQQKPLVASNDGLESKPWESEAAQWSNPVELKPVTVDGPEGPNRILQVTYSSGDKHKAVLRRTMSNFQIDNKSVVSLWVNNPGNRPIRMAIAVKTGNYVYFESNLQAINAGQEWQRLKFDLKASDFKSEETNWTYGGTVKDLNNIKEIQFLIYNGSGNGVLLLDGIEFVPPQGM